MVKDTAEQFTTKTGVDADYFLNLVLTVLRLSLDDSLSYEGTRGTIFIADASKEPMELRGKIEYSTQSGLMVIRRTI